MRDLTYICKADDLGHFLALAGDGTLWLGSLVPDVSRSQYTMEWQPLNGPPDGDFWSGTPFWDRLEKRLREEAKRKQEIREK